MTQKWKKRPNTKFLGFFIFLLSFLQLITSDMAYIVKKTFWFWFFLQLQSILAVFSLKCNHFWP